MKFSKYLIIAFVSIALLLSCSKEDDSPVTPSTSVKWQDYFPLTVGSWWVYEIGETDENYNIDGEVTIDSVVVSGIETIAGKDAYVVETYSEGFSMPSTSYYYGEGSKIYSYEPASPMSEEETWIMRADFNLKTPYTIIDTSITNLEMDEGTVFNGTIKAYLKKGISKNIELLSQNYTSLAIDVNMIMDGNVTYENMPFPMNLEVAGTEYYIKSIGKALFNNYYKMEGMGQSETTYSQEKLVRFHIAE